MSRDNFGDKFFKFNNSYIKLSHIWQISHIIVREDMNDCIGRINGVDYSWYLHMSYVPYYNRPKFIFKILSQDILYNQYTALYNAFLEYNHLEEKVDPLHPLVEPNSIFAKIEGFDEE